MTVIASRCQVAALVETVAGGAVAAKLTQHPRRAVLRPDRAVVHEARRRLLQVGTARRHKVPRGRVKAHRVKAIPPAVKARVAAKVAAPVATAADVAVAMARPSRRVASVSERPAVAGVVRQHRWRPIGRRGCHVRS